MQNILLNRQNAIRQLAQRNYEKIYAHELAHKNAAGQYGGSIVIERNRQGVPVSGYVPIKMPVLDRKNPDATINHADTVIRAALAPHDPSAQDIKVAKVALNTKNLAQAVKKGHQGRRLDYMS